MLQTSNYNQKSDLSRLPTSTICSLVRKSQKPSTMSTVSDVRAISPHASHIKLPSHVNLSGLPTSTICSLVRKSQKPSTMSTASAVPARTRSRRLLSICCCVGFTTNPSSGSRATLAPATGLTRGISAGQAAIPQLSGECVGSCLSEALGKIDRVGSRSIMRLLLLSIGLWVRFTTHASSGSRANWTPATGLTRGMSAGQAAMPRGSALVHSW